MNQPRQGFKRTDRLNDQIRMEIADILSQKVRDPRIGFVTLTFVELTPDLRQARVHVSFLESGEPAEKRGLEGLRKAAPFIRGELGRRLQLRFVPELLFFADHSIEEAERVIKILDSLGDKKPHEP